MCEKKAAVSETLLKTLKLKVAQCKEPNPRFCLQLPEWCPCHSCSPPVMDEAKRRLSLKRKRGANTVSSSTAKLLDK